MHCKRWGLETDKIPSNGRFYYILKPKSYRYYAATTLELFCLGAKADFVLSIGRFSISSQRRILFETFICSSNKIFSAQDQHSPVFVCRKFSNEPEKNGDYLKNVRQGADAATEAQVAGKKYQYFHGSFHFRPVTVCQINFRPWDYANLVFTLVAV